MLYFEQKRYQNRNSESLDSESVNSRQAKEKRLSSHM